MARNDVQLGNRTVEIQDLSGRKALRAMAIVRSIADGWPEILRRIAAFTREYEEENYVLLERAEARHRFPARPLMVDGELVRDENDDLVYGRDPLAHMSDADWEKSDNKLKIRQSPSRNEVFAAVFPEAFDIAREQVTALLALGVIENSELSRVAIDNGPEGVEDLLTERGNTLLDEDLGELMNLAVVIAEVVEEQLSKEIKQLGGRTGKFLKLFGLQGPKSPEPAEESKTLSPTSSISSPASTGGENDERSTGPGGSDSLASSPA